MQKSKMVNYHETVLIKEAVKALQVEAGLSYIDATLGNAGHAIEILKSKGRVLGIDLDPVMIQIAYERLKKEAIPSERWKIVKGNFKDIDKIAIKSGFLNVDGILMDLGVTNLHLKSLDRGFSFENPNAELDMRIDMENQDVKASDLLNVLREDQLRSLFEITLTPGPSKWLSGRVIYSRSLKPIKKVSDLLEICTGLKVAKPGLNVATLPFLALRIAVNSELENLKVGLTKAYDLLTSGGKLVVISFHSGEDKMVKEFFKQQSRMGAKMITFKPITAADEELVLNRRSRSAKMRVLQKK